MKPYTLEWWTKIIHIIHQQMEWCLSIRKKGLNGIMIEKDDLALEYRRLSNLFFFVTKRIIAKYGEQS